MELDVVENLLTENFHDLDRVLFNYSMLPILLAREQYRRTKGKTKVLEWHIDEQKRKVQALLFDF